MSILLTLLAILVVICLWGIAAYNGLLTLRNRVPNLLSQVDVQLKRRHDLIPNLVETAKGYLKHERETLEAVIAARNAATSIHIDGKQALDASILQRMSQTETALSQSLGRLLAVSEAYPDLKANATMQQLTEELTSTENRISFARQTYNDAVTEYNTSAQQFPNNVVAGFFGFSSAGLFQIEDPKARETPVVKF